MQVVPNFESGQLLQEDQFWLWIKNKNSDLRKPPKGHSVSRKKSGTSEFLDLVVNLCHAHPDWFCWPSNEVNCYKKTKFDFWSKTKILTFANLPKVTRFQGKNSGTSEFPDLVVNLCQAHPDKKIEKDLISSRPIGPNDGARLCLLYS